MEGLLPSVGGAVYNKLFQQSLIVHLCKCEQLMRFACDKLTIYDFELAICQVIWEAAQDYWNAHQTLPGFDVLSVHVLKIMQNSDGKYKSYATPEEGTALANLLEVLDATNDLNPEYFMAELPNFVKSVRTSKTVAQYRRSMDEGADVSHMIRQLSKIESDADGMFANKDMCYVTEDPELMTDENFEIRISTGTWKLDAAIDGGLRPGDIGGITACPGTGKTNVCLHFNAVASLVNIESLFLSLELPSYKVKRRYMAMMAGIPADTTKKKVDEWPEDEKMRMAMLMTPGYKGYNKCIILDRSKKRISIAELEDTIGQWKEAVAREKGSSENCLLVCADWLKYILPPAGMNPGRTDTHEILTETMRECGMVAKRQHVALWIPNQGTREADGKAMVRMKDNAGAYHIADALDVSIGLALSASSRITEDDLLEGNNQARSRLLTFNVNKNRDNVLRAVELFQGSSLRFFDEEHEYNAYMKALKESSFDFAKAHRIQLPKHVRSKYEASDLATDITAEVRDAAVG